MANATAEKRDKERGTISHPNLVNAPARREAYKRVNRPTEKWTSRLISYLLGLHYLAKLLTFNRKVDSYESGNRVS